MAKLGHMQNSPTQLSVNQAAEALGVSRRSVLRWVAEGTITATRLGTGETGAWMITQTEVDRVKAEMQAAS